MSGVSAFDRLGLTLFFATAAHAVLILGVSFTYEPVDAPPPDRTLEIMVVQNRTAEKEPDQADFLAQANQEGGGEEAEAVRPKTESQLPSDKPLTKPLGEPLPTGTPEPPKPQPDRPVLATTSPAEQKAQTPKQERLPTTKPKPLNVAQILANSKEIAQLTAEFDRRTEAYAKRPRRKTISAATREYKYANYLDAWKRKVEKIGNLNYPDEARRRKLYGSLILRVSLKADGTIEEIEVRRSSGYKLLDDAAIRIVRLAAPYAPFPEEIRKETDVLDIIRTWQFLNSNRLLSE